MYSGMYEPWLLLVPSIWPLEVWSPLIYSQAKLFNCKCTVAFNDFSIELILLCQRACYFACMFMLLYDVIKMDAICSKLFTDSYCFKHLPILYNSLTRKMARLHLEILIGIWKRHFLSTIPYFILFCFILLPSLSLFPLLLAPFSLATYFSLSPLLIFPFNHSFLLYFLPLPCFFPNPSSPFSLCPFVCSSGMSSFLLSHNNTYWTPLCDRWQAQY